MIECMTKRIGSIAPTLVALILTSITVALLYTGFEHIVKHAIPYIWDDVFNTSSNRILIFPLAVVLGIFYFWAQHRLDPKSEKHEEHGLGNVPEATIVNLLKVLLLGFLSLLAGATLGVESILVPASIIAGSYIAKKLFSGQKGLTQVLAAAAFISLFAAFFHSFIMGMLAVYILAKSQGMKINAKVLVVAAIASAVTVGTLHIVPGGSEAYAPLPDDPLGVNLATIIASVFLLVAGYATTYLIKASHDMSEKIRSKIDTSNWLVHGIVAGSGITLLYLAGGTYVQFTGNQNIVPVLQDASNLGLATLLWIALVKATAVGWSKAMQYRGGMIFPTIFIASLYVDMLMLHFGGVNFSFGLIAVMVGAFAADAKTRILV